MEQWLGQLLSSAPVWLVVIVAALVGTVAVMYWIIPIELQLPGPKSEWQKTWYKKKEKKHGKK